VPADNCVTMTSTIGICTPKATTCAADTDCPAAWTCVDAPPVRGGPTPAADGGAGIAVGAPAPTGNASSIAPGEPAPSGTGTVPAPTKLCQSPLGTTGGYAIDASGTPKETAGGGTGGATGGNTSVGDHQTPPANPGATNAPGMGASSSAPSSGCALGGGAPDASLAGVALALLGLVLSRRRR
jgi:MYXO-CTERM domain-containing protein